MTDKRLLEYLIRGVSQVEIAEVEGLHRTTVQLMIKKLKKNLADTYVHSREHADSSEFSVKDFLGDLVKRSDEENTGV